MSKTQKQNNTQGTKQTTYQSSQKPTTGVKTPPPTKPKNNNCNQIINKGYTSLDMKNLKASNSQTSTNKINTAPPVKPKKNIENQNGNANKQK